MTATCPNGHASATADYCEQCGARIEGAREAEPASVLRAGRRRRALRPAAARSARAGEHFCEACGYDFAGRPAGAGAGCVMGGGRQRRS